MEIDVQHPPVQTTKPQINSLTQESTNVQQNNETEETIESTSSTLQVSETGLTLSSKETKTSTQTKSSTAIDSDKLAQQSVEQFKEDAANDPSLTQNAQAHNVTSEAVANLIG